MKQTPQQSAKLDRLIRHKESLEREYAIIRELPAFQALSYQEINRRKQAWTTYYERVKTGSAYSLYIASRSALAAKNKQVLIENGKQAKQLLADGWDEQLQRPDFRDPYEYYNSGAIQSYKIVCAAIDELEGHAEKAPF